MKRIILFWNKSNGGRNCDDAFDRSFISLIWCVCVCEWIYERQMPVNLYIYLYNMDRSIHWGSHYFTVHAHNESGTIIVSWRANRQ